MRYYNNTQAVMTLAVPFDQSTSVSVSESRLRKSEYIEYLSKQNTGSYSPKLNPKSIDHVVFRVS